MNAQRISRVAAVLLPITALTVAVWSATSAWSSMSGERAGAFVACAHGPNYRYVKRPRKCLFILRGQDPTVTANGIYVISMKWRSWGSSKAVARGTIAGNMDFRAPATVRLSRLRPCQSIDNGKYYTRVRINDRPSIIINGCPEEGD